MVVDGETFERVPSTDGPGLIYHGRKDQPLRSHLEGAWNPSTLDRPRRHQCQANVSVSQISVVSLGLPLKLKSASRPVDIRDKGLEFSACKNDDRSDDTYSEGTSKIIQRS
jgi:hypothetical protein